VWTDSAAELLCDGNGMKAGFLIIPIAAVGEMAVKDGPWARHAATTAHWDGTTGTYGDLPY
jgi:hypothetical protein